MQLVDWVLSNKLAKSRDDAVKSMQHMVEFKLITLVNTQTVEDAPRCWLTIILPTPSHFSTLNHFIDHYSGRSELDDHLLGISSPSTKFDQLILRDSKFVSRGVRSDARRVGTECVSTCRSR